MAWGATGTGSCLECARVAPDRLHHQHVGQQDAKYTTGTHGVGAPASSTAEGCVNRGAQRRDLII